jgi:hypothetical protein
VQLENNPTPERPTIIQVAVVVESFQFMVYSFNSRWQPLVDKDYGNGEMEVTGTSLLPQVEVCSSIKKPGN